MLWFLRDYPLATVVLRAATLAFSALLIGGIFFCAALLPPSLINVNRGFSARALKLLRTAACGLALTQLAFVSLDTAMLMSTGGLRLSDLWSANYFLAGTILVVCAMLFLAAARSRLPQNASWLLLAFPVLLATVWTSHAASRLEHRALLTILTGLHQLAAAVWIGAMPFLWLLLGSRDAPAEPDATVRVVRRYSIAATASVIVLVLAGVGMGWLYTGSWSAVYGTAYGVMLTAKSLMLAALLLLGAANFLLVRNGELHLPPSLLRIARFSEVEIGIGFTIILAAASLGSQPPAVDLVQNRVTLPEIAARMAPERPRFETPPISAMPAADPMRQAVQRFATMPDDPRSANNRNEQRWSEYNHHWAGIVVLLAGLLAVFANRKRPRWTRHWPLVFLGLAAFLLFRADPEAWPLGPRGFWASLYNPEDVEHRLYILLIVGFAIFEWGARTGRLQSRKAMLVFPAVCAFGGALLLTHAHSLGNVKEELLAGLSHTAIALCAVFGGWSRWLELRAVAGRQKRAAKWIWPTCLMFIGLILLNYRES